MEYLLKDNERQNVKLHIKLEPFIVIDDDEYNFLEEADRKGYREESFSYIVPGWALLKYIEGSSVQMLLNIPNEAEYSMNLLKYLLKNLSFYDVKLTTENREYEEIENFDDMIGNTGLHPKLLSKIDAILRREVYS